MRAGTRSGLRDFHGPVFHYDVARRYEGLAGTHWVRRLRDQVASGGMRKILSFQIALIALATGVGFLYGGLPVAQAVLFGGAIACTNTLLLAWRLYQGKRRPHADAGRHLRAMYASAIERFAIVVIFLAAGLGILELTPLPLLLGFILGQLALQISGLLIEID